MAATMFQCNENGYTVQHLLFKTNKPKKGKLYCDLINCQSKLILNKIPTSVISVKYITVVGQKKIQCIQCALS